MSAKKRQVNHVRLTKSHKVCKRLTLICRRSSKRLWKDNTKPNFLYFPFLNVIMKRWRKLLASTVKLLMVLRARPFAKLLPAHTHHTEQLSSRTQAQKSYVYLSESGHFYVPL